MKITLEGHRNDICVMVKALSRVLKPGSRDPAARKKHVHLTREQVREIHRLSAEGLSNHRLGRMFGVTRTTIKNWLLRDCPSEDDEQEEAAR